MVTPVTSSTSGQSSATTAGAQLAGNFDTFLKLLTTQLQNQDPMSPMDSNQFTQQLVQFAGVEQAISTNQNLEKLVNFQLSAATSNAASYLGKEVTSGGDMAQLENGAANWNYSLGANAAETNITITDLAGNMVYQSQGSTTKGDHAFSWDGRDTDGQQVPDGSYKIEIAAADAGGNTITTSTQIEGIVTAVEIGDDEPMLIVNGTTLKLSDITRIATPSETAPETTPQL